MRKVGVALVLALTLAGHTWAQNPVTIPNGGDATQGAKADAKSTATDSTPVTLMQVFKEISFMEQTPASRAVTNAGTFAVQAAVTAARTSVTLQSAAVANGNGATIALDGMAGLVITVSGITGGNALVNFEVSQDGSNYYSVFMHQIGTTTFAIQTADPTTGIWELATTGGLALFRARISSYFAGTITVTASVSPLGTAPSVARVMLPDGADVTLGTKIDPRGTPTDGTAVTVVSILKEISFMAQAPAALPANQSVNVAQIGGTNTVTGGVAGLQAVGGNVANAGTATANPVPIGGVFTTAPTTLSTGQTATAQFTATQRLIVDGSQVTQPVSGTVTTSPPSNASTNVAQFGGSAVTIGQQVAGSSIPVILPSATITTLTPPAAITGFALEAGHVATVDTSTATTAATAIAQEATTSGVKGVTMFGAVTTGVPSYTSLKSDALSLDLSGLLRVSFKDAPSNTNNLNVNIAASGATVPISAASLPLPTLAATSTKQSDGTQKTQIVDGSGNVIASTSNSLNVQCANCSGSGASATDQATFTAATSVFAPSGGEYNTNPVPMVAGQQGMFAMTAFRSAYSTLFDSKGLELGTVKNPVITQAAPSVATPQSVVTALRGPLGNPVGVTGSALDVNLKAVQGGDPCFGGLKQNVAISQTASTRLVAGQAGKRIYVCSARVVAAVAEILSLLEGTGAACATSTVAISGSTTAANGESYAANGGFSSGMGLGTVAETGVAGNDLCLGQSGAQRLAGNITYVIQ